MNWTKQFTEKFEKVKKVKTDNTVKIIKFKLE